MATRLVLDPPDPGGKRILYDLTRLARAARRPFPTGVDRIDLGLALALVDRRPGALQAVCSTPAGPSLPPGDPAAWLRALDRRWRGLAPRPADVGPPDAAALAAGRLRALAGGGRAVARPGTVYVNASHSGLPAEGGFAALDPLGRMRRIFYLHDLIPLDYPEYQTPRSIARFTRFLAGVAARPVRLWVNSETTAARLSAHARDAGWPVESIVAVRPRLAPDIFATMPEPSPVLRALLEDPTPVFLTVGTIEPRKNHLLLLHLWRDFAARGMTARLIIAGRRGWENEMVVDLLERCPSLQERVIEFGELSDGEIRLLIRRARALLFPSFAEGLGLPLMEAAALRTPVIASDLPACREAAGSDAVFLDPLDGAAWRREILALSGDPER